MAKKCVIHEYLFIFGVLVSSEWKAREKREQKKITGGSDTHAHCYAVVPIWFCVKIHKNGMHVWPCSLCRLFCDCALHNFTAIFIDWYFYSTRSIGNSFSLYFLALFRLWEIAWNARPAKQNPKVKSFRSSCSSTSRRMLLMMPIKPVAIMCISRLKMSRL